MKKMHLPSRLLSLLLALALLCGFAAPAGASGSSNTGLSLTQVDNSAVSASLQEQTVEEPEEPDYVDTDMVRVSIVLETKSTVGAGFSTENIAHNDAAMAYRAELVKEQNGVQARIEKATGEKLDVVWNLTLAANLISANVAYGQIEDLEKIPGVAEVVIETRYEPDVAETDLPADPNMGTSCEMIGSPIAWTAGYTGAGSRIAIIDTGTDTDHQSFNSSALDYALEQDAVRAGKTAEEYVKGLHLLDAAEITEVWSELNISSLSYQPEQTYLNTKLPFAFNYVDANLDVVHDNDTQGEHGSHVAGIATANRYIPNGDGTFTPALEAVSTQGVAPDAQLLTMKVFGTKGGAYDSDYMAAIEDAIVLNCDSANLSLGTGSPGNSRNSSAVYQAILDDLTKAGTVVTMSAGNAGSWVENAKHGSSYLYASDVSMQTDGEPGSYTNALAVASINNAGSTGVYLSVGENEVFYTESYDYQNKPFVTIAGEQRYVFIDGFGTEAEWAALGDALKGAVAVCSRGSISFFQKANYAVQAGAIATIIYNNTDGTINMDLTDYQYSQPCVSVTQEDGALMKANAVPVTNEAGEVLYYEGKLTVEEKVSSQIRPKEYNTMSSFSSWGVPGSLELKPEITAPGGNIYSVDGIVPGGESYENMSGTSMAAPQVAGMAALVGQYIREKGLEEKTGRSARQLAQSLLMSTAVPQLEDFGVDAEGNDLGDGFYPVLRQGAGLANVGAAISADSYLLMGENATKTYADGKVKAELGDDPEKTGLYAFSFSIYNLTEEDKTYALSAEFFTQNLFTEEGVSYMDTRTTGLSADVAFSTGDTVTVPAGGSADVKVTAALTQEQKTALNQNYPNGAYIEGYIFAKGVTTDDGMVGTAHSIPVLGFYGNWSDASMFDVGSRMEYLTGEETRAPYLGDIEGNAAVMTYGEGSMTASFGGNPVVPDERYLPERNAINSENGDQITQLQFVLIRNAAALRVCAKNLTKDRVLMQSEQGAVDSAYFFTNGGYWVNTNYRLSTKFLPKGAAEGDRLELSLTMAPEYYVSYDAEGRAAVNWDALGKGASFRIPMVVDNTAPVVKDASLSFTRNAIEVTASDNQYVAAVALYNLSGTKVLAYDGAKQDIEPGEEAEYALDLTGVSGKGFLLQIMDYARNTTTYKVEMQIGEPEPLPGMIAFNLDAGYWISLTKNPTPEDLKPYTDANQTFYAATIVDHYVLASNKTGDLYIMPEDDLANTTKIANMGMVLTDMAYNPADGKIYGVANDKLVTVDRFTGATEVVGPLPVPSDTLACDAEGNFYCNQRGKFNVWKFTMNGVLNQIPLIYDLNDDGQVTTDDVQALMEYVTGARTSISNREHADFDGNGELNTRDVYRFLCMIIDNELTGTKQIVSGMGTTNGHQAMEIDPNTGMLYWLSHYDTNVLGTMVSYTFLEEIDPSTGARTSSSNLGYQMSCLIIPEKTDGSDWATPTDQITGIQISDESVVLLKGTTKTLSASVLPWTVTDRSVTWVSSNPEVAAVNDKGVVTGLVPGEAVITATSVLNPAFTASCNVTVKNLEITLKGALQDQDGKAQLFSWNMEQESTWKKTADLDVYLSSVVCDPVNNVLYVVDSTTDSWGMHQVDPTTGKTMDSAVNGAGVPLWDLVYSRRFSTAEAPLVSGIYYYYFLVPENPMKLSGAAFNLQEYLPGVGATYLVAATSLGAETVTFEGETFDTEHFVLLDNSGHFWNWSVYQEGGEFTALLSCYESNLKEQFLGDSSGNNMFSSMVVGEDGYLYLSAFTGQTNNLYRIAMDHTIGYCDATLLGDFGDDIWPAALYEVESNEKAGADAVATVRALTNARKVKAEAVSAQDLANAAANVQAQSAAENELAPQGKSNVGADEKTVTVQITAKNKKGSDTMSNNGLVTVEYDAASLELQDIQVAGDYNAYVTGEDTLTFGYAKRSSIFLGRTIAELTFVVKEGMAQNSEITVTHKELNDTKPGYVEKLNVKFSHTNTEVRNAREATCTEDGYTGDTYCTDCGTLLTAGEVIPAKGHTFGDWTVSKEATCTEAGEEIRTCSICGTQETREVEALGHSFGDWTVTKEATCTEAGQETRTCQRCQETETREIPAMGHDYEVTVVEPTCDEEGYTLHACTVCGHTYRDEFVDVSGHGVTEIRGAKEATCTEAGYTGDTYCTVCNKLVEKGEVIAPKGHTLRDTIVVPTCTTGGYTEHTCTVCGVTYRDTITPAHGHSWSEWTVEKAPDCFHDGLETRICSVCSEMEPHVLPACNDHCPSKAFQDVDTTRWYHEGVDFVVSYEIMLGMSHDMFQPNGNLTRGQLMTMLYRLAGEPEIETSNPFTDVNLDQYYGKAVVWAAEHGIAKGMTATIFAPNRAVTREQMVTFLYRYAQFSHKDVTGSYDLKEFGDHEAVEEFAQAPMAWAVETGLIIGMDGLLNPKGNATRAQIATIFMRYCQDL